MGKIKPSKQTIKLKFGKRLSKGDNITNTTFKAKKIKIGDKKAYNSTNSPGGKKIRFLELFNNLKNDKSSAKILKLRKIHAIISSKNEFVLRCLNQIFAKVIALLKDEDTTVRKLTLNLMQLILKELSSQTDRHPQYSILKSTVNDVMTHLSPSVRYSSLAILQLILKWLPHVVMQCHSFLNGMLKLISFQSKMKNKSSAGPSLSLIISPGEQTGTFEWRKSVLECLAGFLEANTVVSKPKSFKTVMQITVGNQRDSYLLTKHHISDLDCKNNLLDDLGDVNFNLDPKDFEKFIHDLMPVLFAVWTECAPSTIIPNLRPDYFPGSSATMLTILHIVCHLVTWIDRLKGKELLKGMLRLKYGQELLKKFTSSFPYSQENVNPSLVLQINFTLCYIYSHFNLEISSSVGERISEFLLEQLSSREGTKRHLPHVLRILKSLLRHEMKVPQYQNHLEALYVLYENLVPGNERRREIQMFFTDLSLDIINFRFLHHSPALVKWWQLLPSEFLSIPIENFNETHQKQFEDLLKVCRQDNDFLLALYECSDQIMPLIASENCYVRSVASKLIDPITRDDFIKLAGILRNENVTLEIIENVLVRLTSRCRMKEPGFTVKDFLYFVMNLTFFSSDEPQQLDCIPTAFKDLEHCVPFKLSSYVITSNQVNTCEDITSFAVSQLCIIPEQDLIHSFVQQYLSIFLQGQAIPINTAITALKFISRFFPERELCSEEFLLQLGNFTMACYLYLIAAKTACRRDAELNIDWQILLKELKQNTYDVQYIFRLILNMPSPSELENPIHLFSIGQLLMQLMSSAAFKAEDTADLFEVLGSLKRIHGKKIAEQPWWSKLHQFFEKFSIEGC